MKKRRTKTNNDTHTSTPPTQSLQQIEEGEIDEMIHNVTHTSGHYQSIVNNLIQNKISDSVEARATIYHNPLKNAFQDTIIKTQSWQNPPCDVNERDKS